MKTKKTKNQCLPFVIAALLSSSNFLLAQNNSALEPLPEPLANSSSEATSLPLMMFEGAEKMGEASTQERSRESTAGAGDAGQQRTTAVAGMNASLAEAQTHYQTWSAERQNAIQSVQTSHTALDSATEIAKARERKNFFAQQARQWHEPLASASSEDMPRYRQIVQAYVNAADEAQQVENLWTLRQKKNSNKTALGFSLPGKKHDELDKALEEGIKWAQLTPEQRRLQLQKELLGNHSYEAADRSWQATHDAWEKRAATRWACENQKMVLAEIYELLEQEQAKIDSKKIEKTILGKMSAAADKATSVLQYVSIANMSPAAISQALSIITDVANRKIVKSSLKAADRAAEAQKEITRDLEERKKVTEKDAREKESQAQTMEEQSRNKERNSAITTAKNFSKIAEHYGTHQADLNNPATRFAAWEQIDPTLSPCSFWKERKDRSQVAVENLGGHQENQSEALEVLKHQAQEAEAAFKTVEEQHAVLLTEKQQKETDLKKLDDEITQLEDQLDPSRWETTSSADVDSLRKNKDAKENEVGKIGRAIRNLDKQLATLQDDLAKKKEVASGVWHDYYEKYIKFFEGEKVFQRSLERLKARARADHDAYRTVWSEAAARDGVTENYPVSIAEIPKAVVASQEKSAKVEEPISPFSPATTVESSTKTDGSFNSPSFSQRLSMPDLALMKNEAAQQQRKDIQLGILIFAAKKMEQQRDVAWAKYQNSNLNVADEVSEEDQEALLEAVGVSVADQAFQEGVNQAETQGMIEASRLEMENVQRAYADYCRYKGEDVPEIEDVVEKEQAAPGSYEGLCEQFRTALRHAFTTIQTIHVATDLKGDTQRAWIVYQNAKANHLYKQK